jgi:hypothetical protein
MVWDMPVSYFCVATPQRDVPQGAIFTVEFPAEFDAQGVNITAVAFQIGNSYFAPSNLFKMTKKAPLTVTIQDVFNSSVYNNTPITLMIAGIKNPRTFRNTSSFKIYLTNSTGFNLENVTSNITVQM